MKVLDVREATPADLGRLAELVFQLGFPIEPELLARNLDVLRTRGLCPLVADQEEVIGCITYSIMHLLYRPKPVGRISMLVVTQAKRGRGVGRALTEAVIERLRVQGCGLCEVTSNLARLDAHAFYERIGFERKSLRFVRPI